MIWNEQATEGKGQENRSTVQMRSLSFLHIGDGGDKVGGLPLSQQEDQQGFRDRVTWLHGHMITVPSGD